MASSSPLARRFLDKRRLTTALARYLVNPVVKLAFAAGVVPRGYALLETIGRRSGEPRRTPVGYGREGDTVWVVAEHGRRAGYVRNIEANPHVRVRLGRSWRTGTAHVVPDDDAARRLGQVGTAISRAGVRVMKTELLTVRVDLQP
jgi:deazaflavin-dependent oxidoreductase (nitroreductase family)